MGKSIAKLLTNSHKVMIISPTIDKLKETAEELGCEFEVGDVTDWAQMSALMKKVKNQLGSIDVLINNAGLFMVGEVDDNSAKDIKRLIDVNVTGLIFSTKAAIPIMKQQKDGLIINIGSVGGYVTKPERAPYHASKYAITGFSGSIQKELAKHGIRVTCVYPGKLDTNIFKKLGLKRDMSDALDTKAVARIVKFLVDTDKDTVISDVTVKSSDYPF